jgi:hypothetical protein
MRNTLAFQFRQVIAIYTSTRTTFLWATCCLICFIIIVKPFFDTDLDYGSYRLPNLQKVLTEGVIDRQGMLTPPWHLIPPLIYSEVRVRPFSDLCFPYKYCSLFLSFHLFLHALRLSSQFFQSLYQKVFVVMIRQVSEHRLNFSFCLFKFWYILPASFFPFFKCHTINKNFIFDYAIDNCFNGSF